MLSQTACHPSYGWLISIITCIVPHLLSSHSAPPRVPQQQKQYRPCSRIPPNQSDSLPHNCLPYFHSQSGYYFHIIIASLPCLLSGVTCASLTCPCPNLFPVTQRSHFPFTLALLFPNTAAPPIPSAQLGRWNQPITHFPVQAHFRRFSFYV